MYQFLDIFFIVFHTLVILFNLFGWIWKKTRRANLIVLSLTAFSWFGLGLFYGMGYCACTDWHWQIRVKLGHYDMPASYIKFLFDKLTGLDLPASLVDSFTMIFFFIACVCSLFFNIRDYKRRKQILSK